MGEVPLDTPYQYSLEYINGLMQGSYNSIVDALEPSMSRILRYHTQHIYFMLWYITISCIPVPNVLTIIYQNNFIDKRNI